MTRIRLVGGDLQETMQMMPTRRVYRLTVFVPVDAVGAVKHALSQTGALQYANYADVIWTSSPGSEQFRPLPGAAPTLGTVGQLTSNPSTQLVFSIPREPARLQRVLAAIDASHPWEAPVVYIDECLATQG